MLGRHGLMTAEQVRQAAWDILSAVAKGIDPAAPPAPDRNAITVSALCDWYLAEAEAGRILGGRRRPIKASTLAMDRSRIEAHIRPLLGARQVGALTLGVERPCAPPRERASTRPELQRSACCC